MEISDYIPPNDDIILAAQKRLGVAFHPDYIAFIKSGYDLGDSILDPLEIDDPETYVDMFKYCDEAWGHWGVPRTLLPIVHDNADFYCINEDGGIDFFSHDARAVTESWPSLPAWAEAMKEEG